MVDSCCKVHEPTMLGFLRVFPLLRTCPWKQVSVDLWQPWPRPPQGHKALFCPWQWRQPTTWLSIAFLRNRHNFNTEKHELLFCFGELGRIGSLLDYRPDWAAERFHPRLTNYMFASVHAVFRFYFYSIAVSGWFSFTAPQSQDCNLHGIRRSTSWRQSPRLVLLVLAKCLSFLWRQRRGWVQLRKQPLTYSPLMRTKPWPIRFSSDFFQYIPPLLL